MASSDLGERRQLHDDIFNCKKCRKQGFNGVRRVQPPWDPSKARRPVHKWGIRIGQAPGKQELGKSLKSGTKKTSKRKTIAFVGDAGKRFDQWLLDAGFSKEEIKKRFLNTSITKCYPGEIVKYYANQRKNKTDRKPTKCEIKLCTPFLERQIRLANPHVLIPMGKVAINWFFPNVQKLDEVVGTVRTWTLGGVKYKVVCLPHASSASAWWKTHNGRKKLNRAIGKLRKLRESL